MSLTAMSLLETMRTRTMCEKIKAKRVVIEGNSMAGV